MKTGITILTGLILSSFLSFGQKTSPGIQFPSTPAFSVIGIQTTEIAQPSNPSGFNLQLISPILNGNGTVPADLALEFAPYYMGRGDYTWKDINEPNFWKDFKFSIATNQVEDTSGGSFSRMGVGFRSYILGETIQSTYEGEIEDLATLANVNSITESFDEEIENGATAISQDLYLYALDQIKDNPDFIRDHIQEILDDNRDDITKANAELKEITGEMEEDLEEVVTSLDHARRSGDYLQLAGAVALDFPHNTLDYSTFNRMALWLDYTYKFSQPAYVINVSAIARVSNYSFDPTVIFENFALFSDLGLGLNVDLPSLNLVGQVEYIGKFGITDIEYVSESETGTFRGASESKWTASLGYRVGETNNLVNISLSDILSDEDYMRTEGMQFLLGFTMSLLNPE